MPVILAVLGILAVTKVTSADMLLVAVMVGVYGFTGPLLWVVFLIEGMIVLASRHRVDRWAAQVHRDDKPD
jgi:hypothetical protein